jgi:hypothetical protein
VSRWSRHSRRTVPTQRSANAFALGARTGVHTTLMPAEAMTVSKAAVNFVQVTKEEAELTSPLLQLGNQVACHLGHPGPVGVGGHTEDVHGPAVQFDDEQHVVTPQRHGVYGEKVSCPDARGLGVEELRPARPLAAGGRRNAMPAQYGGDAPLRDGDAELFQFTDDAQVAPARVLPCQAADELYCLAWQCRPSGSAARVGPGPAGARNRRPTRAPGATRRPAARRTRRRCQPSTASGVTRNERHRSRGTRLERRATNARSHQLNRGRGTCRRSTAS